MEIFVKGCYKSKLIRNSQGKPKIQWVFLTQIPGKTPIYQTSGTSRNNHFSLSVCLTHTNSH